MPAIGLLAGSCKYLVVDCCWWLLLLRVLAASAGSWKKIAAFPSLSAPVFHTPPPPFSGLNVGGREAVGWRRSMAPQHKPHQTDPHEALTLLRHKSWTTPSTVLELPFHKAPNI